METNKIGKFAKQVKKATEYYKKKKIFPVVKPTVTKKKFPKKAKLISGGGLYRIIPIKEFVAVISLPIMRKLTLSTPEVFYEEQMKFMLKFQFSRVYRGYAEYKQFDFIKLEPTK